MFPSAIINYKNDFEGKMQYMFEKKCTLLMQHASPSEKVLG
jgi:hypothetical protein